MFLAWSKFAVAGLALAAASLAWPAQERLDLQRCLSLARERNGTVRAAFLAVEAARSRRLQALSAFFPSVTPSYEYLSSRVDRETGPFRGLTKTDAHTAEIAARWQLLDSGERAWALSASRLGEEAQRLTALQTLRRVLFSVHQQYFDALRAQELMRVAEEQVSLAENILRQTRALVEQGESPAKDILQAEADYLNAKVQLLVAKNRVSTAEASLRAAIGWPAGQALPSLAAVEEPKADDPGDLASLLSQGIASRPDLQAERLRTRADRYDFLRADRAAKATWSLDANYGRQFSEDVVERQSLSFVVSLPLFDGGRSREAARQARLAWEANLESLAQLERDARAEIESAYREYVQNAERVAAARSAVEAARKNFEAAEGSRLAGASDLIATLTARVSLATAESNYVEAVYDTHIADVRLRLAVGREISGER
ncbi:MAG: TolC family protein [Fimbriimonadales bacterium]|nr:TolC family protein [Fimbriimonadales bacterium]